MEKLTSAVIAIAMGALLVLGQTTMTIVRLLQQQTVQIHVPRLNLIWFISFFGCLEAPDGNSPPKMDGFRLSDSSVTEVALTFALGPLLCVWMRTWEELSSIVACWMRLRRHVTAA